MPMLQPEIVVSSLDLNRLEKLLSSMPNGNLAQIEALEDELERAEVVEPSMVPPNVVTMNSTVRFSMSSTKEEFCLTLVYPNEMTADGKTISILAPAGSAMLGLKEGDIINWAAPEGKALEVKIEEVLYQPERAGELHR